jgi:hypothetical protein
MPQALPEADVLASRINQPNIRLCGPHLGRGSPLVQRTADLLDRAALGLDADQAGCGAGERVPERQIEQRREDRTVRVGRPDDDRQPQRTDDLLEIAEGLPGASGL